MKFGEVPVETAEDAILAHSLNLPDGTIKKGKRLAAADIARLKSAGISRVVVARPSPEDVMEDAAAERLASAIAGGNIGLGRAFTGRCNLFAERPGVVCLDRTRIDAFNLIDEAVTVATLPPFEAAARKQMVATVKVIPFAVAGSVVADAEAQARDGGPLIELAPFREKRVGLIQTVLPGTREAVIEKGSAVVANRVTGLGSQLVVDSRCPHDVGDVAGAVGAAADAGCDVILIAGASAITDRRDTVPAGLVAAGGNVDHFGMPVDPGNLLLLGHIGSRAVVGLPGCVRSPKLNGADWVLQRLLADVPVGPRDIMTMGAGGLLKEIASRPMPRAGTHPASRTKPPSQPRIAGILLAAGQSRRMGRRNKLLAEIDDTPMIARAAAGLRASAAGPLVVVTGHEADKVRAAVGEDGVSFVHNPAYGDGLSGSIRVGLAALPDDVDGVVICLGDMPRVGAGHIDKLIAAFSPEDGRAICVPTYRGKRGNPVLWSEAFFSDMMSVAGDVGARHLIGEHADQVTEVEMADDGVLIDVDTPDALTALHAEAAQKA